MGEYRVALDLYSGPLDLLLFLIRREEIDIHDIPIERITEQYQQYVEVIQALDPNAAGDYLVMLATLIEIKSRLLLPTPPADEDDEPAEDPRAPLVQTLLEYKQYRDAAQALARCSEERALRHARRPAGTNGQGAREVELEDVEIWDLLAALTRVLRQVGGLGGTEVVYDDTPISVHAAWIVARLEEAGGVLTFERLFAGRSKAEIIGLFIALLELVRERRVQAEQDQPFGTMYLYLLSGPGEEELCSAESAAAGGRDGDSEAPGEDSGGRALTAEGHQGADNHAEAEVFTLLPDVDEDETIEAADAALSAVDRILSDVSARLRGRRGAVGEQPAGGEANDGESETSGDGD